jgi:hypothetical protein
MSNTHPVQAYRESQTLYKALFVNMYRFSKSTKTHPRPTASGISFSIEVVFVEFLFRIPEAPGLNLGH